MSLSAFRVQIRGVSATRGFLRDCCQVGDRVAQELIAGMLRCCVRFGVGHVLADLGSFFDFLFSHRARSPLLVHQMGLA
jgi:hypothetical protein